MDRLSRLKGMETLFEFTPQQVKMASGLWVRATKKDMVGMATRMFGAGFNKAKSSHVADAAFVALAGHLKLRQREFVWKAEASDYRSALPY